ncbi:MAG: inorganic diphosphatase [Firmicutes bacterium]|nr:inorganic diphosphatase [Bacillota bacterium]
MNPWHDIDEKFVKEDEFFVVVEIKKGSRLKYEVDKETGLLVLDRVLATATHYPCNYGFIPRTLSEDGDALDVLVLMSEPVEPMSIIKCTPVGVLEMIDDGERDEKIIAVPLHKKGIYRKPLTDISQVNPDFIDEISHFMQVYKGVGDGSVVEILPVQGKAEAKKIIKEAKGLYAKTFAKD